MVTGRSHQRTDGRVTAWGGGGAYAVVSGTLVSSAFPPRDIITIWTCGLLEESLNYEINPR